MENNPCRAALIVVSIFVLTSLVSAQKVAVIVPEKSEQSQKFAEKIETSLSSKFKILDSSLSETAFRSISLETPFNLTTDEAKMIGATIGSEYFLFVKTENQRRASLSKSEYYESFAPVYLVSARTGRLIFWKIQNFEAAKSVDAEKLLFDSTADLALEIAEKLKAAEKSELNEKPPPKIEEVPAENTPEAKNFRAPLPYKRLKPIYTKLANRYGVKATIDILVDLDENGAILRTEIVRWAGFGLDESVTEAIRQMNWRAAERNGKTLPMRVLLRYNFKKIEKEDEN